MVAVAKRIRTDAEMHLLKGKAMAWAIWFACVWWRKSTLWDRLIEIHHQSDLDSGAIDRKLAGNDMKYSTKKHNK
jgi:hypothetical protein